MKQVNDNIKIITEVRYHFAIPVFEAKVDNVNNTELAKFSRDLRDNYEGVKISNRGGWHSKDLPEVLPDELVTFLNTIERYVQEYTGQFTGADDLVLGNFWININGPYDYNTKHDHQNSLISGVYYIEVPNGDSGDLILDRGDTAEYFLGRYANKSSFFSTHEPVKPETGKLVLFPSWTKHSVERNNTTSERISIAFNFVDPEKVKEPEKENKLQVAALPAVNSTSSWG